MKVVIVGGVAGGASAAARLRRLDEEAEIIMLERGSYISYANCGLPYYVGGDITDGSELTLQTPESFYQRFRIIVKTRHEVLGVHPGNKRIKVKKLEAGEVYEEVYDKLILSPGANPVMLSIPGSRDHRIFTLRNIPDTYRIKEYIDKFKPEKALVAGGGYIGVEMAENLKKSGVDVTLVERENHIIGAIDLDTASEVQNYLRTMGIRLILNDSVSAFHGREEGLEVQLSNRSLLVDFVLMAVGVSPDTGFLQESGIKMNPRGAILVNSRMETSVEDIYAVGDAIEITNLVSCQKGYLPLAGPANKQGRIAADNICGMDSRYKGTQGSSVLKLFDMTVAATGITERSAKEAEIECDKVFLYPPSHATYYPGASLIGMKVIFETGTGKILGAQLTGTQGVDKRTDVIAAAIRGEMTAEDLAQLELTYAPPFSSAKDPVNMAGFMIENILNGIIKQYHWNEVEDLKAREDVLFLDVRMEEEFEAGHIEGAVSIPLHKLRDQLTGLDPAKKLYVNCQSGLRSYIACRILMQKGFECYNLSGGYHLYESIQRNRQDEKVL